MAATTTAGNWWVHASGASPETGKPYSARRWVNTKTGRVEYADQNPGGQGKKPATPPPLPRPTVKPPPLPQSGARPPPLPQSGTKPAPRGVVPPPVPAQQGRVRQLASALLSLPQAALAKLAQAVGLGDQKTGATARPAPTTVPGAVPAPAGAKAARMTRQLQAHLDGQAHLSGKQKKAYGEAAGKVLARMPPAALSRMARNVRGFDWHGSTQDLTRAMYEGLSDREAARVTKTMGGGMVAGTYDRRAKRLALDGAGEFGGWTGFGKLRSSTHEVYAHEFTHAVDGPNQEISSSPEWRAAWKKELVAGGAAPLSDYASTKTIEGFAEFGRLVYGSDVDRAEVEREYPLCVAVWKKHGIW